MSQAPRNPVPKPTIKWGSGKWAQASAPVNIAPSAPIRVAEPVDIVHAPETAVVASAAQSFGGPSDQWIERETNAAGLIDNTFIYMYDGTQSARSIARATLHDVQSTRLVTTRGPAR